MSTAERLSRAGLSEQFIASFWQPLFAGIQLDPRLEVSSRRFDTILRMIAVGSTRLPRQGMGAIRSQIGATLPPGTVRLDAQVTQIEPGAVVVRDGDRIAASAVVCATDGPTAHGLLGGRVADPGSRAAACCWFSASSPPARERTLMLDGTGDGPALTVVVCAAGEGLDRRGRARSCGTGAWAHETGRRAAGRVVRFEHGGLDAPADGSDTARAAASAAAAEPAAAGGPGRRTLRRRRSPRHGLRPGRDVQRRAHGCRRSTPAAIRSRALTPPARYAHRSSRAHLSTPVRAPLETDSARPVAARAGRPAADVHPADRR